MDSFHAFTCLWLGGVAFTSVFYLGWAIRDLRAGSSQVFRYSLPVDRHEEPYQFWLAITNKLLAALVMPPLFFWFGLGMLR